MGLTVTNLRKPKQIKGLQQMCLWVAQGDTLAEIAGRLGLTEEGCRLRLKHPWVSAQVLKLREGIFDQALGRLTASACKSIATVEQIRDDPTACHADRLRACQVLLDKLLSFRPLPSSGAVPDPRGDALQAMAHDTFQRLVLAVRQTEVSIQLTPERPQEPSALLDASSMASPPAPTS